MGTLNHSTVRLFPSLAVGIGQSEQCWFVAAVGHRKRISGDGDKGALYITSTHFHTQEWHYILGLKVPPPTILFCCFYYLLELIGQQLINKCTKGYSNGGMPCR